MSIRDSSTRTRARLFVEYPSTFAAAGAAAAAAAGPSIVGAGVAAAAFAAATGAQGVPPPQEIDEVKEFDLADDVLAVGDESHFTIVNPRRKYTGALFVGASIKVYFESPAVNGGAQALAHSGIITRTVDEPLRGTIKITTADKGWHLRNNAAPLWYRLTRGEFTTLIDPAHYQIGKSGKRRYLIDPSWGIKGWTAGPIKKNNLNQGRRGIQRAISIPAANDPIQVIQAEPGDSVYDLMSTYARRKNLFITVGINEKEESYIRAWRPNYSRAPAYDLRCTSQESNIIESSLQESLDSIWTDVECIGEQDGLEILDVTDPNTGKKRGAFYNSAALPFLHRLTFGDGEVYKEDLARNVAGWRARRGLYDSWYVQYRVPDHYQVRKSNALWWEADELVSVEDEDLGLSGPFYISAVQYQGSRSGGDVTILTLRKPALMSPAFGEMPNYPIIKGSPKTRGDGKSDKTDEQTEVIRA